ncbi:TIGR02269 family lipoprotein [Corallococcus soli]|uniref:SitA6 family polymorphic toxin lipoprotein n=1 Tax=Corallococcus soli TaxID=2710757 RepID=UPI001D05C1BB|nr:TIGR02269 family lipoprotein [Corallococcus soli]
MAGSIGLAGANHPKGNAVRVWPLMMLALWVGGCATTPSSRWASGTELPGKTHVDEGHDEDACLALHCARDTCGLYADQDPASPQGRVVHTFSGAPAPITPRGSAQRHWGSAQELPGNSLPVFVFRWHPREPLPSEVKRRQAMEEWASRPKERHHIFPQAMKAYFQSKGINVHDYVIAIDAEVHRRIHREADSGPWNTEWMAFRERTRGRATKLMHFDQASWMIQRFDIFGLTMTYWQGIDLTPQQRPEP